MEDTRSKQDLKGQCFINPCFGTDLDSFGKIFHHSRGKFFHTRTKSIHLAVQDEGRSGDLTPDAENSENCAWALGMQRGGNKWAWMDGFLIPESQLPSGFSWVPTSLGWFIYQKLPGSWNISIQFVCVKRIICTTRIHTTCFTRLVGLGSCPLAWLVSPCSTLLVWFLKVETFMTWSLNMSRLPLNLFKLLCWLIHLLQEL